MNFSSQICRVRDGLVHHPRIVCFHVSAGTDSPTGLYRL